MPRPLREDYDGAWHHVMNRGASHANIFVDDIDRTFFIERLSASADLNGLDVHGYALMSNHYHLLLHSRRGLLSKGMQRLASDYTHHVNRRHLRDGALFRGRFKSVEIETDAQLLQTLRYIHLNPVKSGSSARPENWHWSSAAAYLQIASKPSWLTTQLIMDMFGGASIDAYRDFMSLGVDELTTERYLRLGW